jgi:hypothetical protein
MGALVGGGNCACSETANNDSGSKTFKTIG